MPGHENHKGNIIADKMAKAGVNMKLNTEGQEPRIVISKCVMKQKLKEWKKEHNRKWQDRIDCRHTKLIFPQVEYKWRRKILNYKIEDKNTDSNSNRICKSKKTQIYNEHRR